MKTWQTLLLSLLITIVVSGLALGAFLLLVFKPQVVALIMMGGFFFIGFVRLWMFFYEEMESK